LSGKIGPGDILASPGFFLFWEDEEGPAFSGITGKGKKQALFF